MEVVFSMSKFRSLLSVGLVSLFAVVGSGAAAGSASAVPVYSFCHKVPVNTGTFEDAACAKMGGSKEWVLTFADTAETLLVCEEQAGGKYQTALCNSTGLTKAFAKVLTTKLGGTPLLTGKGSGNQILRGTLAGASSELICATLSFSTQPEESGKSKVGVLNYTNCSVIKPAKCSVKEVEAKFNDQLEVEGGAYVDKFTGSGTSEKFAEIKFDKAGGITAKCALEGPLVPVKGSQTCAGETLAQSEVVTLKHTVECKTNKSNLTLGGNPASYEGKSIVEPENHDAWAILLEV